MLKFFLFIFLVFTSGCSWIAQGIIEDINYSKHLAKGLNANTIILTDPIKSGKKRIFVYVDEGLAYGPKGAEFKIEEVQKDDNEKAYFLINKKGDKEPLSELLSVEFFAEKASFVFSAIKERFTNIKIKKERHKGRYLYFVEPLENKEYLLRLTKKINTKIRDPQIEILDSLETLEEIKTNSQKANEKKILEQYIKENLGRILTRTMNIVDKEDVSNVFQIFVLTRLYYEVSRQAGL